jgi:Ca2+-binding RTX toxin-like protein
MGRTVTLTSRADEFIQGSAARNIEIRLFTLGGNDQVLLNRVDDLGGGNVVDTGSGRDIVENRKESGNVITLGTGNDTYIGRGFGSFATDPFDEVFGGKGDDLIAVETFKSRYFGGADDDSFFSVGWQNTFNGGSGTDSISYAPRDTDSTQGGSAVTINLAQGFAQTGASRRETLISIENATGSGAGDLIIGNGKANRLEGAGGADELEGGGGADRFVFAKASHSRVVDGNFDLIIDFSRSERDRIDLGPMDANSRISGNQSFTFIGTADFSGRAGQLRVERDDGGIFVFGDLDGNREADFVIGLQGVSALSAADFIL